MKVILIALISLLSLRAEDLVEFRGTARGEYRYADVVHNLPKSWNVEFTHIGVTGNNEFNGCVGYSLPSFKKLTVTPSVCGTVAKEDGEAGAKAAVLVTWEHKAWKGDAYLAHFQPMHGNVHSYDTLDAGNITRSWGKWKLGISTGFFRQNETWNPLVGPLVRHNDSKGFWSFSFRTGSAREYRFGRFFDLNKPRKQ